LDLHHIFKIVSELDPNIKALVIRMDRVPFVDQSGLYALEEAFFQLEKRTHNYWFTIPALG
jgi:SulP family sulfate permease